MNEIRLYWWRPKGRRGRINLGDEINQKIVEAVSRKKVTRADLNDCDMLAIGSVLSHPQASQAIQHRVHPYVVWGTGLMGPAKLGSQEKYAIAALRGPLTRCVMDVPGDLTIGDPGLLVSDVWPNARQNKYPLGIIPHQTQLNASYVGRICSENNAVLIDFTDPDIEQTLAKLASCARIISSSLHGLVIADSYSIPNAWISPTPVHGGNNWKFLDYFTSVGRTRLEPISLLKDDTFDCKNDSTFETASPLIVQKVKSGLLAAFPFK